MPKLNQNVKVMWCPINFKILGHYVKIPKLKTSVKEFSGFDQEYLQIIMVLTDVLAKEKVLTKSFRVEVEGARQ